MARREVGAYYAWLGITTDAQNEDIAKAFRKMALRYHPELNQDSNVVECRKQFRQVAEAYEVLSDPKRRAGYDEYGEDALKAGDCPGVPAYAFSGDAEGVFKAFFGVANPFQMIGELSASDGTQHQFFSESAALPRVPPQCPAKELTVDCTLDELYSGAYKKLNIDNDHLSDKGAVVKQVAVTLQWQVAPGTAPNERVTFAQKGTTADGYTAGDVHVTLRQLAHQRFVREGDDLVYTHTVQLKEALCGFTVEVPTLDGRTLRVFVDEVVHPKYTKCVRGEGMPRKGSGEKGDLIIRFETVFPTYLTDEQRQELRLILQCPQGSAA